MAESTESNVVLKFNGKETSELNPNVREQLTLAYYALSAGEYERAQNLLMTVSTQYGIPQEAVARFTRDALAQIQSTRIAK